MNWIIFAILFILWLFSYVRFKRQMRYYDLLQIYLVKKSSEDSLSDVTYLELATVLTMRQRYKDAYELYKYILLKFPYISEMAKDRCRLNMEFCRCPFVGIHGPKNFNSSWFHNFILLRLGKRRYNFLTEDTILAVNSISRNAQRGDF